MAADRTPACPTCGSDDVAVRLAGCRGQQWELDVDPWHFNLPGYPGHREAPMADRTPNELADRLDQIADPNFPGTMGYTAAEDLRAAAARLRQLDTLRNAIGDPRLVEHMFNQANCGSEVAGLLGFLRRIADALAAVGDPDEGR